MKKMVTFFLVSLLAVLVSGCGSSQVEGTWYSVIDETMYNFSDNTITVAGVIVGQYEDNGESVVISLLSDNTNLKLFVTQMDDIVILADVKQGDGNIYFCRGLENVSRINQKIEEKAFTKFQDYITNYLFGVWIFTSEDAPYDKVEITEDYKFFAYRDGAYGQECWVNLGIGTADGDMCAILTIADDLEGKNEWDLLIYPTDNTYTTDSLLFGIYEAHKQTG